MLAKLKPRLSYANVTATLALIVAMGGTAYAAATITGADVVDNSLTGADVQGHPATVTDPEQDGSLTTYDIKNGSLEGLDLADNTVTSAKIANGTLTQSDLAPGSVGSGKVIDDSLTGTDINESTLAEVPSAAKAGVRNATIVPAQSALIASEADKEATADCPNGQVAVGGGYILNGNVNGLEVVTDGQFSDPQVWDVHVIESTPQAGDWYVTAKALCVDG
jgi:hypothetical protein